jgi:ubiquinone/menaquinone biosynthesis C-methylase UbiE
MSRFLHVGCGPNTKADTTAGFNVDAWQEVRLDIDPDCTPDIIGSVVDMASVPDAAFDAIFSSHSLEHVYAHEVPLALKEFDRVLNDDGFIVATCPDLQAACEAIVRDKLLDPLYTAPSGPIAPIDMLFGHRGSIEAGKQYMAHKCGFTYSVLSQLFLTHGFKSVFGGRRGAPAFDLWIIAFKQQKLEPELSTIGRRYLP